MHENSTVQCSKVISAIFATRHFREVAKASKFVK